ncbi:MAG: hypothetical protein QNJ40_26000 [Xanthomonadales bacterium]|nr:hypothetical protein [Xanthomonadales bacterium]
MKTLVFLLAMLIPVADAISMDLELLKVDVQLVAASGSDVEVMHEGTTGTRGTLEFHSWEKHDNFRGDPINVLVSVSSSGELWVRFWINEVDTWLTDDDELLVDVRHDLAGLVPRSVPLHTFPDGSSLYVTAAPRLVEPDAEPATLDQQLMGLNFLCLKQAAVVLDDAHFLGRMSGIAARFTFDVPDFNLVTISMEQFEGYEPIGVFKNGMIHVPLGDEHEITVNTVRFGPNSTYLQGPFTVFGRLDPPEVDGAQSRKSARERVERRRTLSDARKVLLTKQVDRMTYAPIHRISSDLMRRPSPQLEEVLGSWGTRVPECNYSWAN